VKHLKCDVYIARCTSYEEEKVEAAIKALLDGFGGAKKLAGGKRVLIKPNLLMPKKPDTATTTHPTLVCAVAREFVNAGCDVVIAESCGGPYNRQVLEILYRVTGMNDAAQKSGARLNFDTSCSEIIYEQGKKLNNIRVISPVKSSDFIISLAKLKTHGFMYYTGAVKNLFGVIPGLSKPMLHKRFPNKSDFAQMLVDICEAVSPSLSIIDGVTGMQGKGPSGGIPKNAGVILGGINAHALDLAAVNIMGFKPENVPTLSDAAQRGLIPDTINYTVNDTNKVFKTDGIPDGFLCRFAPPPTEKSMQVLSFLPKPVRKLFERFLIPYPLIIKDKCIGCGSCAKSCPQETISLRETAVIDYSECIKCYCCHELCPVKAIDFKKMFFKE
jgi:uncharacterized protein (DUF362 family)/ferredoxin